MKFQALMDHFDDLIASDRAEIAVLSGHVETLRAMQTLMANKEKVILDLNARIQELEARGVRYDYESDFSKDWTLSGFSEQAKKFGRATLVTVDGKACVRLHTEPGDNNVFGSDAWERNDLALTQESTDGYEGREHKWEHAFLFPDDWEQPPNSDDGGPWGAGLVFNFHSTANRGEQANFQISIYPNFSRFSDRPVGMEMQLNGGNQQNPTRVNVRVLPSVIEKNKWYHCQYHVRWASDETGFFRAWMNGVLYLAHKGPTLWEGHGVYLKLANYHAPTGKPSSVIHTGVRRVNV